MDRWKSGNLEQVDPIDSTMSKNLATIDCKCSVEAMVEWLLLRDRRPQASLRLVSYKNISDGFLQRIEAHILVAIEIESGTVMRSLRCRLMA